MTKDDYIEKVKQAKKRACETPKCCATCEFLTDEGFCTAFQSYPPLDYIGKENDCPEYSIDIPF